MKAVRCAVHEIEDVIHAGFQSVGHPFSPPSQVVGTGQTPYLIGFSVSVVLIEAFTAGPSVESKP